MRNLVKFSFIAFVLLSISCSNDFPPAPEMKFCKLSDENCKSVHLISERDCEIIGGEIVYTCKEKEDGEEETD